MVENHFPLDPDKSSTFIMVLQIIFGIACISIAVFWIIYNIESSLTGIKIWAAVFFLFFFGTYQIMGGLGKTNKYITTSPDKIRFKQHSFLPGIEIIPGNIEKIEIYPLSIQFHSKSRGKIRFRFGISYPEIIDPVKQEIISFSEYNNIPFEIVEEEI